MELRGLEPLTSWLPATRSSQLSYSPGEFEISGKGNTCLLSVAGEGESEAGLGAAGKLRSRQ